MFCYQKRIFVCTPVFSRVMERVRRTVQRKKMRKEINRRPKMIIHEEDESGMKLRNCKRRTTSSNNIGIKKNLKGG